MENAKFNFGWKNNNFLTLSKVIFSAYFMTLSTEIIRAIENIQKGFLWKYGLPKKHDLIRTSCEMEIWKISILNLRWKVYNVDGLKSCLIIASANGSYCLYIWLKSLSEKTSSFILILVLKVPVYKDFPHIIKNTFISWIDSFSHSLNLLSSIRS